jgi:vancomycin resistance protein VanJ
MAGNQKRGGRASKGVAHVTAGWVYVALLLVVWAAIRFLSDDVALPTLIAFGPRWAWAVPLLVFAPRLNRGLGLPVLAALIIVLGPIMGFIGTAAWGRQERVAGWPLRIVTANLASRKLVTAELVHMVGRLKPDIVLMQECTERAAPAFPPDLWSFREDDGLCLASRHPVDEVAVRYRRNTPGHGAFGARYRVRLGEVRFEIANLHLDSPRDGIASLLQSFKGLRGIEAAIAQRREQSRLVRDWLAAVDEASLIVAGDFNLTPDGAIYRESWGDLQNAFSEAGLGWGYTKRERWGLAARIDHILLGRRWLVGRAWLEAANGSDHRPLVADITLTH